MEIFMEISIRSKEQLGLALRRFRKARQQTQIDLEKESRIDQSVISKLEAGVRAPEFQTLLHLCSVLGIEVILRDRNTK